MKAKMIIKVFLLLSIGYIAVCLFFYFFQERIIFLPETLEQDFAYEFTTPHREINLIAEDGAKLNGLLFESNQHDSKGCILYFHGNAGSLRRWGEIANDFLQFGYDVVIMDYRTYGKSTGKISENALHRDALLFYEFVNGKYPANEIVIFGRSIGTGIATKLATTVEEKMLILETPYFSLVEMAGRYAPFLPYRWLIKYRFRSDLYLPKANCPIFIFHGTEDSVVPYESGKKLSKAAEGGKIEFITVEGGEHNNLSEFALYRDKMEEVLTSKTLNF